MYKLGTFTILFVILKMNFSGGKLPEDPMYMNIRYNHIVPHSFLANKNPFGKDKDWLEPNYGKLYSNPKYYPAYYEHNVELEDDDESLRQCHKTREDLLANAKEKAAKIMKDMQRKGKGLWRKRVSSLMPPSKYCSKGTAGYPLGG